VHREGATLEGVQDRNEAFVGVLLLVTSEVLRALPHAKQE
jgi:hypothetical protein